MIVVSDNPLLIIEGLTLHESSYMIVELIN